MPDPALVRTVHSDLLRQRHNVHRALLAFRDGLSEVGLTPPPEDDYLGWLRPVEDGLCEMAEGARGYDVYVIDTDVIRLAMDVVCSTGIEAEWLDLVPEQGVFLWDADDLGASSPLLCSAYGAGRYGHEASGLGFYDWGVFLPSGVVASGRCRKAVPVIGKDVVGWRHPIDGRFVYEPAMLSSLESDDALDLTGIVRLCGMQYVGTYMHNVPLPNGLMFDMAVQQGSWRAGRSWSDDMGEGRNWLTLEGLCMTGSSRIEGDASGIGWRTTEEAEARTRDALASRGFPVERGYTLGGLGLSGIDQCAASTAMLLAAVFALRAHPELVGSDTEPETYRLTRSRRRQLERKGVDPATATSTVTTIHLREQPARPASDPAPGHRDVQYACRWIVHGHFTHQPCGPNRSERRLTWIAPYIKGPAGKPLKSDLERTVNIRL